MIAKILGIGDLFAIAIIILFPLMPHKLVLYAAYYLIIKGGVFFLMSRNIVSAIDVICGLYVILMTFGISLKFFTVLTVLFLGQKAAFSLM